MKLLVLLAIVVLPWEAFGGRTVLFKGVGTLSSSGGFLAFGPTEEFVARVIVVHNEDMLTHLGYKLEFEDGREEIMSLIFQNTGKVDLVRNTGEGHKSFDISGSWSTAGWFDGPDIYDAIESIEAKFGDIETGPTLEISIMLVEMTTPLKELDIEIPDAKITIRAVNAPSRDARDLSTHKWDFSVAVDLNSLRDSDSSTEQLAKELLQPN